MSISRLTLALAAGLVASACAPALPITPIQAASLPLATPPPGDTPVVRQTDPIPTSPVASPAMRSFTGHVAACAADPGLAITLASVTDDTVLASTTLAADGSFTLAIPASVAVGSEVRVRLAHGDDTWTALARVPDVSGDVTLDVASSVAWQTLAPRLQALARHGADAASTQAAVDSFVLALRSGALECTLSHSNDQPIPNDVALRIQQQEAGAGQSFVVAGRDLGTLLLGLAKPGQPLTTDDLVTLHFGSYLSTPDGSAGGGGSGGGSAPDIGATGGVQVTNGGYADPTGSGAITFN